MEFQIKIIIVCSLVYAVSSANDIGVVVSVSDLCKFWINPVNASLSTN